MQFNELIRLAEINWRYDLISIQVSNQNSNISFQLPTTWHYGHLSSGRHLIKVRGRYRLTDHIIETRLSKQI